MQPLRDDWGRKPLYWVMDAFPDPPPPPKAIYYVVGDALLRGLHHITLVSLALNERG